MSPRPYKLGRRRATTEQTRGRVISAARELLGASEGFNGFSIDAVAERAGVARMTVYYQFGSRRGLLEALFDDLAARHLLGPMRAAFACREPLDALADFIAAFSGFWASERVALRRLRGLTAIDRELEESVRARDERRRQGLQVIVRRLNEADRQSVFESFDATVDILLTLTGFEVFDSCAGATRSAAEVTTVIQRLAIAALDLRR